MAVFFMLAAVLAVTVVNVGLGILLWRELRRQAMAVREELRRVMEKVCDVEMLLRKIEKQGDPSDEESRISREVQEGVENLLRYSADMARGARA